MEAPQLFVAIPTYVPSIDEIDAAGEGHLAWLGRGLQRWHPMRLLVCSGLGCCFGTKSALGGELASGRMVGIECIDAPSPYQVGSVRKVTISPSMV